LGTGGKLESKTIFLNLFDQGPFAWQRVAKTSAPKDDLAANHFLDTQSHHGWMMIDESNAK